MLRLQWLLLLLLRHLLGPGVYDLLLRCRLLPFVQLALLGWLVLGCLWLSMGFLFYFRGWFIPNILRLQMAQPIEVLLLLHNLLLLLLFELPQLHLS